MNIFEYFRDDDKRVKAMAAEIVEHYADWPQDRVFESVKRLIEAVEKHMHRIETLLLTRFNEHDPEMESVMARWSTKKLEIKDVIDGLVMVHVDEPGFEDTLMRLSKLIENLARFDKEELYPKVQEFATEKDLQAMNKNFQTEMQR
ncbi:MAG: hypothetical protein SFY67_13890 [Candidatus Melainabacteria bacterium]|nr:hypothetical protein [Candidatus Melainabacteria bacterium]